MKQGYYIDCFGDIAVVYPSKETDVLIFDIVNGKWEYSRFCKVTDQPAHERWIFLFDL